MGEKIIIILIIVPSSCSLQVHTEYFFCSVCHAEVKHCHRNVLMHLQRSHGMNTQVGLAGRLVA